MSERLCVRFTWGTSRQSRLSLGLLALLMGLTACGGGGGGSEGQSAPERPTRTPIATSASRFFPLDANGVAIFSSSASPDSIVVQTTGIQTTADQQTATLIRRHDPIASKAGYMAYVVSEAGLRQYSTAGADAIERAFDGSYVMRWPAHAGDKHVQLDTTIDSGLDFDGDGLPDRVTLRADVTVLGLEKAITPAGVFENSLHQQQVFKQSVRPSSGKPDVQLTITTDTWYAPGIGIVRQVQTTQGLGGGGTVTQHLVKYRFGAMTNDNERPAVLSFQLIPGTQASANAKLLALFNEEMDEASFKPESFAVIAPDGRAVSGTVRVAGRSVEFTPAQPLPTGTYKVVIKSTVQDMFGHQLADDWVGSFYVDATAPQVLSTWPVADSINVPLTTSIGVALSEMPSSASVNADTVQLRLKGSAVKATVRAMANSIVIEPPSGLERGSRYEVVVDGVTDIAGNPLAQGLRFSFETTPGRFANPERILHDGVGAYSLAAGDINSDGIPDIVYSGSGDEGYPDAVYFRAGRTDGQLGPSVRLNLANYFQGNTTRRCPISGLAIGDLTGDGRSDLSVASWNCGVLILRQTPAGALEPGQFIDERIQVLRIADINGDSRSDLVGVQSYWNKAFVWLQKPDATLVLDQTPGLGDVAGRDVSVGDINGDGMPDLVVALRTADISPTNIAILVQQPNGRFSTPHYLSSRQISGIWGVALGDFNGDGRMDIAGTTTAGQPASLMIFLQAADGSFPLPTAVPTADGGYSVLAGDINGDGRVDLVVNHEGFSKVGVYLQRASGDFAPEELYEAPGRSINVQVLDIADINRDGLVDIIGPASLLRQVPLTGTGPLGAATRSLRIAPNHSSVR